MANESSIDNLKNLASGIHAIDEDELLRPRIGALSLKDQFTPILGSIKRKLDIIVDLSPEASDNQVATILNPLQNIKSEMEAQAGLSDEQYASNKEVFLINIDSYLDELTNGFLPFLTIAVEKRGFFDDESIRQQHERMTEELRKELEELIAEAREQATQIRKGAHETATGVSVKDAQEQFEKAQTEFDKKVTMWARLSGGGVFLFFAVSAYFLFYTNVPDQWQWHVIYSSAIKISILAAIGTLTTFCLKMFRSHMHMSEKNKHRQRVANCIGAFVGSATTSEQRDLILSQLVEAVVQFGDSGLLHREDDNVYRPKMTIDSIMRTISPRSPKDVQ